jgi:hypothetical protein
VGVDDIEIDGSLVGGRVGGAVEERGFELRDAVEPPGGVRDLLGEEGFGGSDGLVFVEELAVVLLVGGVLRGQDGGVAGKAVGYGIQGRTLFAGGGAWSGGEERVGAVSSVARLGGQRESTVGYGIRDWGWNRLCHEGISGAVLAWADGDNAPRVADVVGWAGKIGAGVA